MVPGVSHRVHRAAVPVKSRQVLHLHLHLQIIRHRHLYHRHRVAGQGADIHLGQFVSSRRAVAIRTLQMAVAHKHIAQPCVCQPGGHRLPVPYAAAAGKQRVHVRQQQMVLHTQHQTALFLGAVQLFLNPLKMRFRITGLATTVLVVTQRQQPNFLCQRDHIRADSQMGAVLGNGLPPTKIVIKIVNPRVWHGGHIMGDAGTDKAPRVAVTAPVVGVGDQVHRLFLCQGVQLLPQLPVAHHFTVIGQISRQQHRPGVRPGQMVKSGVNYGAALCQALLVRTAAQFIRPAGSAQSLGIIM